MIFATFHDIRLYKNDAASLMGSPAASGFGAKGRGEGGLGAYPLFGLWSLLNF